MVSTLLHFFLLAGSADLDAAIKALTPQPHFGCAGPRDMNNRYEVDPINVQGLTFGPPDVPRPI